ncbi:MAG: PspC domain-containing protein [Bryobacterales bacterium]|nr:PspC domain-containing protein [Bryobacterales bacterium]
MFCTQCSREIPADARYCSACGKATGLGVRTAPKRLFRLSAEKKIAGVCAGFAEYLDVDATLIRILTLVAICLTGFIPGLIAYILAWILMPPAPVPAPIPLNATP